MNNPALYFYGKVHLVLPLASLEVFDSSYDRFVSHEVLNDQDSVTRRIYCCLRHTVIISQVV
jgi:hypothetical protein